MQSKNWFAMITAGAMLGFGAGLSGCDVEDEGVYDETEENLNDGLNDTGDAIDDAADDTGDAIDEGIDETEDAFDEPMDEPVTTP